MQEHFTEIGNLYRYIIHHGWFLVCFQNDALDELRGVIPYAHSPSVRKLSKIATLLLAKNYILMQASALEELRRYRELIIAVLL